MTPLEALLALWLAFPPIGNAGTVPPLLATSLSHERPFSPASLLDAPDEELARLAMWDLASLGPLSIGAAGGGRLLNPVELERDSRWEIAPNSASWGTTETMEAIRTVVGAVHDVFPDTPAIFVGDISNPDGGRLKRHQTHQSGTDVDFGFYYLPDKGGWYTPGTVRNLDLARNWALVRAMVTCTDVERILLDTRIQRLLYRHALSIGEDKEWLDRVFQVARGWSGATVRHVVGHRTHYHVRFHNPVAQELGRRVHPFLVQLNVIPPPVFTLPHVVRPGQTLGHLARRYGVSVRAIMQANGLRSTSLRAGRTYRIPMRSVSPSMARIVVPPRQLPPVTPDSLATFEWPTAASMSSESGGGR
jgi:penicillin-insensitive murein endopeptidase